MIIAIDGPAASGKGTLSKRLADHYGLRHLDTGKSYRAVAKAMQDAGHALTDAAAAVAVAETLDFGALADPSLASPEIGEAASKVAPIKALRKALVARQRSFALKAVPGAVLDGRDIGTVVLPDAPLKLYVTASVDERARRRALEAHGHAEGAVLQEITEALRARDARDMGRAASPLRPAEDAVHLDTTTLDADGAFAAACAIVNARFPA
ncbi:MAG: (d)CMP kinase [Pseudomonadota bacterium]